MKVVNVGGVLPAPLGTGASAATPPVLPGFQAFTFDGKPFAGTVANFKQEKGVVSFDYAFVWRKGVEVTGSFEGEVLSDFSIAGRWKEAATDGTERFEGTARLDIKSHVDRLLLAGTWNAPDVGTQRWIIDLPIHEV